MDIRIDDLIKLEDTQFVILDLIDFSGNKYAFLNKIVNDNPKEEYRVYLIDDNNEFIRVINDNLINSLLPIFEENITKRVEKYLEENGEDNV